MTNRATLLRTIEQRARGMRDEALQLRDAMRGEDFTAREIGSMCQASRELDDLYQSVRDRRRGLRSPGQPAASPPPPAP